MFVVAKRHQAFAVVVAVTDNCSCYSDLTRAARCLLSVWILPKSVGFFLVVCFSQRTSLDEYISRMKEGQDKLPRCMQGDSGSKQVGALTRFGS